MTTASSPSPPVPHPSTTVVEMRTTTVGTPWRELVFVQLRTDTGLTGVGEVRMLNKTATLLACVEELAGRYVVGADPFEVERLAWNIQRGEYGRVGEVTASALAAFDVACWDLMGQTLGVPVWKLLGGAFRRAVPAYANGWYQTGRDPDAVAAASRAVVDRGYRALKLDPFGAGSVRLTAEERRRSVAMVAAVREAVGPDVALMIEMHGRFAPAEAVRVARLLEPYDPEWLEEPVPPENPAALQRVRQATDRPIATGERVHAVPEFRELIERGLADVIQADLTHCGGFTAMRRLAGWVDAYYLELAPHNVCGPVGTAAALHFAAATPAVKVLEHFNDFSDPWVRDLVDGAPTVDHADGHFHISDRPGLGVTLDEAACAEHPRTGARLNLFQPGWERRDLPGTAEGTAAVTP